MERNSPLDEFGTETIILDGGLATQLELEGEDLNDPLWSAAVLTRNPEIIKKVHLDYLNAGADIITTASYQATFEGFAKKGLNEQEAEALLRLSSKLTLEARDEFWKKNEKHGMRVKPLVAGSIGCYGAFLADGSEYKGDYAKTMSKEQLKEFHRKKMAVLLSSGVDLLACETVPCILEAEALMELLEEFKNAFAWISFSCRNEYQISYGDPFVECVKTLNHCPQVVAIGINCTDPMFITGLLKSVPTTLRIKPFIVYPNSGETWNSTSKQWIQENDREKGFGKLLLKWIDAGAKIIGGCCRTTPADIQQIRKTLKDENK